MSAALEHARRALAEANAGRLAAAVEAIDRALALDPQPAFFLAKGEFLVDAGRAPEAAAAFEAADRARPGDARTLNNLAWARLLAGDAPGAQAAAEGALAADPGHALALANLGRALHRQGAFTRAEEVLAEAARRAPVAPASASLHLMLANTRLNLGRAAESIAAFDAALACGPADAAQVESARLVAMHYDDRRTLEEIFAAHRAWAARHAAIDARPAPMRPRAANGRLRVGYVSPRLHQSTAGVLLAPVVEHHDTGAFEVYAYACSPIADDLTARMKARCAAWRDASALDDEALARLMRQDGIDIAVDLAGHTPGHRLGAFARRPAPVAVNWLDYFDTTGVEAIDALVTDVHSSPAGDAQPFTERLVRLPGLRYCWTPPAGSPPVRPLAGGPFTFGSFNRLAKFSPASFEAWCAVLRAVPGSRLVVKSPALDHADEKAALVARFAAAGLDPARIAPRGGSPHAAMLDEYGDLHAVLDSFPYNGGLTTIEALWMGRPVVALAGSSLIARQSAAILAVAGEGDLVAADAAGFVAIASRLAADRGALAARCAGLRGKLAASGALDAAGFTRALEDAYRGLWSQAVARRNARPS